VFSWNRANLRKQYLTKMATIKKTYQIRTSLEKVYEALTDPELIEEWSGDDAIMTESNLPFSFWGGSIHGVNKMVTKNKIVQDWKEEHWESYSLVTFLLSESEGVTTLELIHEDVPERSAKSIDKGWDKYYLSPLKEMLEGF